MDVINAVRILSTTNLEEMRGGLSFWEGYHLQRMKISKRLLKVEAYKLLVYFSEQSLWPRFWQKDSSNGKSVNGFPWQLSVVASLVRHGHATEESWTMPEAAAIWMHMAHMKSDGSDVQVISETEWEAMEKYKQEEASKAAA